MWYICDFLFVTWFLSSHRHIRGFLVLRRVSSESFHTWVWLVLTGSSDKGGG